MFSIFPKKSAHCLRGGKTGSSILAAQPASKWKLCKGLSVSLAEARADSLPLCWRPPHPVKRLGLILGFCAIVCPKYTYNSPILCEHPCCKADLKLTNKIISFYIGSFKNRNKYHQEDQPVDGKSDHGAKYPLSDRCPVADPQESICT